MENYNKKYLKYKKKYTTLKEHVGGAIIEDRIINIKTGEYFGKIVEILRYVCITNKYIAVNKRTENSEWKVMKEPIIEDDFNKISQYILTKHILNPELLMEIEEIAEISKFKDYMINKYYALYYIKKKTDVNGEIPRMKESLIPPYNPAYHAKNVMDKLIDDVRKKDDIIPNKKYIILCPGDSPSKIAAYILLVPEYVEELKKYNIEIILFPISRASCWSEEYYIKYIGELLESVTDRYNKSDVFFGMIDAIYHGTTLTMINKALVALSYENIIEIPGAEYMDKETGIIKSDWSPNLGYNLIEIGEIYEGAELHHPYYTPSCRCTPQFKMEDYILGTWNNKDYREQLYNCNIFLYYWYTMRDNMKKRGWHDYTDKRKNLNEEPEIDINML